MKQINDGGPAFPRPKFWPTDGDPDHDGVPQGGMSVRDYFAGKALVGYLASHAGPDCGLPGSILAARAAYEYADAMIAARTPTARIAADNQEAESGARAQGDGDPSRYD